MLRPSTRPDTKEGRAATRREILREILERVDALRGVDQRSEDEILGYDQHGIPAAPM
jgi:hypothetical protein